MAGITLKPMTGATPNKAAFTEGAGKPKVLRAPKKDRVVRGDDSSATPIKIMFFGAWGTGKTYTIKGLLEQGLSVVAIVTDIGGDGFLSVKLALRKEGKAHLLKNLHIIVLNGDGEVQEFLDEPAAFMPDIYDTKVDVLVWEGFSGWQQIDLYTSVGENAANEATGGKVISDARAAGNKFEVQDWGVVKNATVKAIDKFCSLNNKKTGQIWHKIVTCHESVKSKSAASGGGLAEQKSPMLTGAGGIFSGGAFDLIIRTVAKTERDEDEGERKYLYVLSANQNNMSKNRGFDLPPTMPANMFELWGEIEKQAGITRGAINENVKGEVLLVEEEKE